MLDGTFAPSAAASSFSKAPHFNSESTKVIARFSVGGGHPHRADYHADANPKGIALRFLIDDDTHTEIILHSFNGFPVRTGEDFFTFLNLFRLSSPPHSDPAAGLKLKQFLGTHPSALGFVTAPKPQPHSYGTLKYYGVNTHVLTNAEGKTTNIRYRFVPKDGEHLYTQAEAEAKAPDYLNDELKERLPSRPVVLTLEAQVALDDDVLDDATINYKSTNFVALGDLTLNAISEENVAKQKDIIFSPVPKGVEGVGPSADPLIQIRYGVYNESGRQRRSEDQVE